MILTPRSDALSKGDTRHHVGVQTPHEVVVTDEALDQIPTQIQSNTGHGIDHGGLRVSNLILRTTSRFRPAGQAPLMLWIYLCLAVNPGAG